MKIEHIRIPYMGTSVYEQPLEKLCPISSGRTGSNKFPQFKTAFSYILVIMSALIISKFIVSIIIIHGPSMEPTFHSGQFVLLNRQAKEIQPGDIVVTNKDNILNSIIVKRVIAVGGQHLRITDGQIWIDNQLLKEPWLLESNWGCGYFLELTIPPNEVFLLGDNRNNSVDSRELGCIKENNILGTVLQ